MQNLCREKSGSPLPPNDPGIIGWRLVFEGLCRRYGVDIRDLQRASEEQRVEAGENG